jgi:hypothetical protein
VNTTNLSQAVFLHVGEIYEQAVDAGMHLGDVQRHLGSHGIHKPMLAIKNELNNLYCFYGYADSHPAPRVMSYAEVDAVLAKSGRRTTGMALSHGQGQMIVPATTIKTYQTHCNL